MIIDSDVRPQNSLFPSHRGQFEYELVLKTDMYTKRHTQWYYFRVQNMVPGIIYKFRIVNLLKKDSLYNYGKFTSWLVVHTVQPSVSQKAKLSHLAEFIYVI